MLRKLLSASFLAMAGFCLSLPAQAEDSVLKSAFAGSWYSSDPKELSTSIKAWMNVAGRQGFEGVPIALIQPHAGYAYAGKTMACGAALLKGADIERVVILGPSHRLYLPNKLCVPKALAMETPLGSLAIDSEAVAKLSALPFVVSDDKMQFGEHSIQMQLPMLREALGGKIKILPVMVGILDDNLKSQAADAILRLLDSKTLVIASSDFTHYGENYSYVPFRTDIEANIRKLDMGAFDKIKAIDAKAFDCYIDETGETICGEEGISLLLRMLPKDAKATLLKYDSSGAQSGDFSNSVSYLSIAFSGSWAYHPQEPKANAAPEKSLSEQNALSDSDKKALLQIARKSLRYGVNFGSALPPERCGVEITPAMRKTMGAFVTLTVNGELRGCIGEIRPSRPLCEAVAERAVDSALNDSRFLPLTKHELDKVRIEISALSPSSPIASWKEIALGKHGVTLSKDGRSAVFLPQVAPEQGWTLEEMLSHLSRKAGLSQDAWKHGAAFSVFEATVFKEDAGKGK